MSASVPPSDPNWLSNLLAQYGHAASSNLSTLKLTSHQQQPNSAVGNVSATKNAHTGFNSTQMLSSNTYSNLQIEHQAGGNGIHASGPYRTQTQNPFAAASIPASCDTLSQQIISSAQLLAAINPELAATLQVLVSLADHFSLITAMCHDHSLLYRPTILSLARLLRQEIKIVIILKAM
jgi:hypothetical protein